MTFSWCEFSSIVTSKSFDGGLVLFEFFMKFSIILSVWFVSYDKVPSSSTFFINHCNKKYWEPIIEDAYMVPICLYVWDQRYSRLSIISVKWKSLLFCSLTAIARFQMLTFDNEGKHGICFKISKRHEQVYDAKL